MTSIELDMIQTAGIGALALLVGMVLTRKVAFLQKFCVPSPVSGGIIFSLITLALYGWFDIEVSFDGTLKDVFMLAFPLLGRDYDAAVLCAGLCGFGLGATPNAMANMSAVCYKYRYTVKPFLIVPIIGAMFADLINTGMITLFLNIL